MLNGVPYLQSKIQFVFYGAALICLILAAYLPSDRERRFTAVNVVALALALALAPTAYIYFKAAFHHSAFFH